MRGALFPRGAQAIASGKVILAGEHAVVYGHRAVAAALPGVELRIHVEPPDARSPRSWSDAWFDGGGRPLCAAEKESLLRLWRLALKIVRPELSLEGHSSQRVLIDSDLPRGAGLGSSAALSVATLRLFVAALRADAPPRAEEANRLDSLFHGKASGVDVATVLSGGVVEYVRGGPVLPIALSPRPVWLMLADTGTRASTRTQVERLASLRSQEPGRVEEGLQSLGRAAAGVVKALESGDVELLGSCFNLAHEALAGMELSSGALDAAVQELRSLGARGAKLTGSGGGGVAIGVFDHDPLVRVQQAPGKLALRVVRLSGAGGV